METIVYQMRIDQKKHDGHPDEWDNWRSVHSDNVDLWKKRALAYPDTYQIRELVVKESPYEQVARIAFLREDRNRRTYIAGPMTGLPEFNFPAFNTKAAELRAKGWHVENPAEHGHIPGAVRTDYLRWDLSRVVTCGHIHFLPGWEASDGARLEEYVGKELGLTLHKPHEEMMDNTITHETVKVDGKYNWKNQNDKLIYMGARRYPNDSRRWHQFARVETPNKCWSEVLDSDLSQFEETPSV